jgi:hypothetical protein
VSAPLPAKSYRRELKQDRAELQERNEDVAADRVGYLPEETQPVSIDNLLVANAKIELSITQFDTEK